MSVRLRLQAHGELLLRYVRLTAHHWQNRRHMAPGTYRSTEAEFLPAALSLIEQPVSPTVRWSARAVLIMTVTSVAWSIVGRVDIVVVAAGKVIPSSRVKTVASVETASVRAIHVREGQAVKAGELLLELDAGVTEADSGKAKADLQRATLQAARAAAMVAALERSSRPVLTAHAQAPGAAMDIAPERWRAEQRHLDGSYLDFVAKRQRLDDEIARCQQALPLAAARAEELHALLQDRDVARHAWSQQEQARVDLQGQLAGARNMRQQLLSETRREALDQLSEATAVIEATRQDVARAEVRRKLMQLTASVDGTVQQLTMHTVGGVVAAAQPLMQIVPQGDAVEIEAYIDNRDIGYVQQGQTAVAKIETFDYSKHGTIPAVVEQIAGDAMEDQKKGPVYATRVRLLKTSIMVDGHPRPLVPGMAVNVEIKAGDRRLIDYVLSPLIRHTSEAMRER